MILDNRCYIDCYRNLGRNFPRAIDYLKSQDLSALSPGRYEIFGDEVYCIVQEQVNTVVPEVWEMHQQYADIQYIIEGCEQIGVFSLKDLSTKPLFLNGSDNAVVKGLSGIYFNLNADDFLILFPQDIHKPNCPGEGSGYSKKVIVKVRLDK